MIVTVAQVAGRSGRRQIALVVRTDEVTLAVIQAVVWCRRLGESLRSGHGNVSRHLISSTSWLPAVKCQERGGGESEFCACRACLEVGQGHWRRTDSLERCFGVGASGAGSQQGLTMLYRVSRRAASGDGGRAGRLMGFPVEVSRQAVWYGSRRVLSGRRAGVLEVGGGPGLAVGRSLVTREYLTNSRSAGLGCARAACWRRRMKNIYRHGMNGGRYCHCQGSSRVRLSYCYCAQTLSYCCDEFFVHSQPASQPASTNGQGTATIRLSLSLQPSRFSSGCPARPLRIATNATTLMAILPCFCLCPDFAWESVRTFNVDVCPARIL